MVTIENDCFSIPQICESGQCFRLDPVSENTYELLAAGRYLKIEVQREARRAGKRQFFSVHRKNISGSGNPILTWMYLIKIT